MTTQNVMINPKELGAKFRVAREALKLSLDDVNQQIRIHPSSLTNIEQGEFNDWPGGSIYGKSFVRKYADFLKMNTSEIMSEFERVGTKERRVDLRIGNEKTKHQGAGLKATWVLMKRYRRLAIKFTLIIIAVIAALAVLLGFFKVAKSIGSVIHKKRIEAAAKPKPIPKAKALKTKPVKQGSAAEERKQPKPKVESIAKSSVEPIRQLASEPVGTIEPVRVSSDASQVNATVYLNSPELDNFPKIRKQDPLILEVLATVDVWMKLTADGKVLFEEILKKGVTERWIADQDLQVKFGRPEGVLLTLNGYSIGKPGDGQAKHIHLTRSGMANI